MYLVTDHLLIKISVFSVFCGNFAALATTTTTAATAKKQLHPASTKEVFKLRIGHICIRHLKFPVKVHRLSEPKHENAEVCSKPEDGAADCDDVSNGLGKVMKMG